MLLHLAVMESYTKSLCVHHSKVNEDFYPPRSLKLFLSQPLASPALSFKIQNFSKSSLSKPVVYHTLAFKAFGFSSSSLGKSWKCFSNSFWAALTCQPATSTNCQSSARTGALSKICFSTKIILAKSCFNNNLNAQNHCFWCVAFWNCLWTAVPQITGQPLLVAMGSFTTHGVK